MGANRLTRVMVGAAIAALMAAAGCGANPQDTTSPTSLFGSSTVSALASPEVPIFNVEAAGLSSDGRGPCLFDPRSGRFGCDDARNGLSFSRTVTFFDANGAVQTAFDPITTASIKTETSVKGSFKNREGATVTIDRKGLMVVSGLEGTETTRTLNGNEQGTVNVTGTGSGGVSFTTNHTVNDTTVNLVVPVPQDRLVTTDRQHRFPLSGSRTHATTTTTTRGTETKTQSVTRKETFDGTAIVQVELTINGVTQNCTVNLETHTSTCQR